MLPKARRLTTEDFARLKKARVVHAPHFFLRLTPTPLGTEKSAVIVSGASYKKAVDRNLLRRRMYHIIEKHESLIRGVRLTVTIKKGALAVSFKDLEQEFCAPLTPVRN